MSDIQTKVDLQPKGSKSFSFDFDDGLKMIRSFGIQIGGVVVAALVAYFSGILDNPEAVTEQYGPVAGMIIVSISTVALNFFRVWSRDNSKSKNGSK